MADGEVSLDGSLGSRQAKRLAEDLADSVAGVRDVRNGLRIGPNGTTREAPRRVA